jgi:SAM-dependent methyltransferase
LHPHLLAWAEDPPDVVLDIGCAEGYYAVGLARLYRSADVYAFDIDPKAREACAQLASRNGVSDRVHVGGEFSPADFAGYAGRRGLVIVDAEGAELDILRPDLARDLVGMHIIVETHDVYRPGALRILVERFSPTHDITQVDSAPKVYEMPGWLKALNPLDQLLAAWEWRLQPTPWLVMSPKQP